MGNSSKDVGRNNQETIGRIMDTSRMTASQISMHMNKVRQQQSEMTKEQFEKDLQESIKRTPNSGTALFGANKNIFDQQLTKDANSTINLNRRKHEMIEKMIDMIGELNAQEFKRFESFMIEFFLTR